MDDHRVEIDIAYNDYFMEVYTIDCRELQDLIPILKDDERDSFTIGDKVLFKKDLNAVSIVNHSLGFIYMDVM